MHRKPEPGWRVATIVRHAALLGLFFFGAVLPATGGTTVATATDLPQQLGDRARADWQAYRLAASPKAFAVAIDGAWSWVSGESDLETAAAMAMDQCGQHSQHGCQLFASDQQVVFDPDAWRRAWGPYTSTVAARFAQTGLALGQRFPDLVFTDPQGQETSVAQLRGRVLLVHFWGSWCPPCKRELPALAELNRAIAERDDISAVLLPVRETYATAAGWLQDNELGELPLYDSGVKDAEDDQIRLTDGSRLPDRYLARVFPSTYVLDRSGLVVFSHRGPIENWLAYLPMLEDAAQRSGAGAY